MLDNTAVTCTVEVGLNKDDSCALGPALGMFV